MTVAKTIASQAKVLYSGLESADPRRRRPNLLAANHTSMTIAANGTTR